MLTENLFTKSHFIKVSRIVEISCYNVTIAPSVGRSVWNLRLGKTSMRTSMRSYHKTYHLHELLHCWLWISMSYNSTLRNLNYPFKLIMLTTVKMMVISCCSQQQPPQSAATATVFKSFSATCKWNCIKCYRLVQHPHLYNSAEFGHHGIQN